jgi:WD40 repeat protein
MGISRSALLAGLLVALFLIIDRANAADPEPGSDSTWREQSRRNAHGARCTGVAFSLNGRLLSSVGDTATGSVALWDAKTGERIAAWDGHKERIRAVAFSPDSRLLATGGGTWDGPGEVKIWDVETHRQTAAFAIENAGVLSIDFSPDGKLLAIGSGYFRDGRYTGGATFYSLAESRSLGQPLQGHTGETPALQFSPDGNSLVTSSGHFDGQMQRNIWELKLWDVRNGRERATVYSSHADPAETTIFRMGPAVFSRDGKKIAFGGRGPEGGVVRLYDVATSGSVLLPGHKGVVWSLGFAPDGRTLAVGDGEAGVVRLWDVDTATQRGTLASFQGAIFSLAYAPDGSSLVAAGTEVVGSTPSGLIQWWVHAGAPDNP